MLACICMGIGEFLAFPFISSLLIFLLTKMGIIRATRHGLVTPQDKSLIPSPEDKN